MVLAIIKYLNITYRIIQIFFKHPHEKISISVTIENARNCYSNKNRFSPEVL